MKLIFLQRDQIDDQQWDQMVESNPTVSASNFTWFLDTISENWGAYKAENADIYFPLPFLKAVKNKMLYQPIFSRVLSIICEKDVNTKAFIDELRSQIPLDFKHYLFHADFKMNKDSKERVYQKIESIESYKSLQTAYSKNCKRQIKKYPIDEVDLLINSNSTDSLGLMKKELGAKIPELKDEQFRILDKLIQRSRKRNLGHIFNLFKNHEIKATGFFILKGENLIFLKGAAKEKDMKQGAMYTLMNTTFQHFDGQINSIDFDGSNIESVAEFYKKFGAKNYTYYQNSNSNKIPLQYKIVKKLF